MKTNNIDIKTKTAANNGKKEIQYSYFIRAMAILVVIIDHCFTWYTGDDIDWKTCVYVFGGDSLLFFMLTGVHNLPVTYIKKFYANRIIKIAFPTVLFIFLYAFLDRYVFCTVPPCRLANRLFLDLPFYTPEPWLWFMYVMVGLYLMAPFVSQVIINGKRGLIETFLVLWLLTGLTPYIEVFFGQKMTPENTLQPFMGYVGYMIAGWYLHRYPYRIWGLKRKIITTTFLAFGVFLPFIINLISQEIDNRFILHNVYKNNLSLGIMCITLSIFIIAQNIKTLGTRFDGIIRFIAKISFPMYLLHGLGEYFVPYFKSQDINITFLIITLIIFTICGGYLLKKLLDKMYNCLRDKFAHYFITAGK